MTDNTLMTSIQAIASTTWHFKSMPACILLASLLIIFSTLAWSDDERDHDAARMLRLQGEILPLTQILQQAEKAGLETILEIELEQKKGTWNYEIEGLSKQNRLIELTINASSGAIIDIEHKKRYHKDYD